MAQRAQAAVELIGRLQQQAALDAPADAALQMPALPETPEIDPATFNLGAVLDQVDEETGTLNADSPQMPDAAGILESNGAETAEDGQD